MENCIDGHDYEMMFYYFWTSNDQKEKVYVDLKCTKCELEVDRLASASELEIIWKMEGL